MRAGCDGKCFQQRAVSDLAGMAVEVIDAMIAGIEGMHDQVMVIDHFETPGLGVIAGGRPAGEFKNICDVPRNLLHSESEFAFGKGDQNALQGIPVAARPPGQSQLVAVGVEVVTPGCSPYRAATQQDFQGLGRGDASA